MTKFTNYLLLERNIVNAYEVTKWIESISENFNAKIKSWLKSNLKNYMLRDYEDVMEIDYRINSIYISAKQKKEPWIQKAIDRGDVLYIAKLTEELENQIYHVLDYFRANPDLNISRMSVPEAIRQSERWTEELNKKASDKEDKTGLEEVRKYPDGFRWVKVTSKQSLDREGKLMKHCVGSYCSQVSSGSTTIYSLRDKKNEPHCTVEVRGSAVNQIKGKANGPVDNKYIKYVQDFVMKPVSGKQYTEVHDLKNIGLIEVEGKYYEFNNIPENLHVKGNLNLERTNITFLPKGLTVGGFLALDDCTSLKSLPKGLKVGGSLDLNSCTGLTSLPKGLKVGGSLYLRVCTNLTSLPKGLIVNGNLDLHECTGLTSLPKGLKVGGNLYLYGSRNLRSLPDDLEVNGNIYVSTDMKKYFKDSKFRDKIKL